MVKKVKLSWKKALRLSVGLVLFAAILYWVGTSEVMDMLLEVDLWLFTLALCLWIGGVFLSAFKWQVLLNSKKEDINYLSALKYYFVGTFFNRFLPTNIGGDAVRAYDVSKKLKNRKEAISSVYVERITGLMMLMALAVASSLIFWKNIPTTALYLLYGLFLPATMFLFIASFSKSGVKIFNPIYGLIHRIAKVLPIDETKTNNLKEKIVDVHEAVIDYKKNIPVLLFSLLISLLYHISLALRVWIIAGSLGEWPSVLYFFFFIPLIDLLLYLPISIRGMGVREVLYLYFFSDIGISSTLAVSMAVLFEIIDTITSGIGGLVMLYTSTKNRFRKK